MPRNYHAFVLAALWAAFSALVIAASLSAQTKAQHGREQESLYSTALRASIFEMEKQWGYIDDSVNGYQRTNYHHMYVEADEQLTDGLPRRFGDDGDYEVEYLSQQSQIERCKKLGKPFAILKMNPIRNDGAKLTAVVSLYYVEYKKNKLLYAYSSWSVVEFVYDCEKRMFVMSGGRLGGV